MRSRPVLAVLAAFALLLAACGDGDEPGESSGSPTAGATVGGDEASAELDEGVAAVVNGDEIPVDTLDSRIEAASAAPQVAEILAGEDGVAARAQLQASILSQLIVNEIVLAGAADRGLEVDDDAVAATRDELTTQAGGDEAFETQVSEAGLDDDQLTSELEAITALRLVREDLAAETEDASPAPAVTGPDGSAVEPADVLLQRWLLEQLQSADIVVAPEIGTWDPAQGTVVPPAVTPDLGDAGSATDPASDPASDPDTAPPATPTPTPTDG